MSTGTFYLGFQKDLPRTVAGFLLNQYSETGEFGNPDLSRTLVVLPGRQAIRAVTEALSAVQAYPPEFATPGRFLEMGCDTEKTASIPEQRAVWLKILRELDYSAFENLFPNPVDTDDLQLLLFHADKMISLRRELSFSAYCNSFEQAAAILGTEDPRWLELRALERTYLEQLKHTGLADPNEALNRTTEKPDQFQSYRNIVFAACPDLAPVIRKKINKMIEADICRLDILIAAPDSLAGYFDEYGCVIPKRWEGIALPFSKTPGRIISDATIEEMALTAARLAPKKDRNSFNITDTVIAITDPGFYPDMERAFTQFRLSNGTPLPVYDPAGISMNRLRIIPLLTCLDHLIQGNQASAKPVKDLLHHPDFLRYLAMTCGENPDTILILADEYFTEYIPDVICQDNLPHAPALKQAIRQILDCRRDLLESTAPLKKIRELLGAVFFMKTCSPKSGIPLDDEAEAACKMISSFEDSILLSAASVKDIFILLRKSLSGIHLYPEHPEQALEITGYLDLLFRPASRIILCGMNEGLLPERIVPDEFLSERRRGQLGLPDNASRFARDSFYLKSLMAVMDDELYLLASKTDHDGATLRFSSFFFLGTEDEIISRANILFSAHTSARKTKNPDWKQTPFLIQPNLYHAFENQKRNTSDPEIRLSVTDFKELLSSPIRAFFSRVLKMEPADYEFPEMDAAFQGTFIHSALEHFEIKQEWKDWYQLDEITRIKAEEAAGDELYGIFAAKMTEHYGKRLPVLPELQLQMWRPRINKTAKKLLESADRHVLELEWQLNAGHGIVYDNVLIVGKIDRIEYDASENTIYLIDFKTGSDDDGNPIEPEKQHVTKKGVFKDLQLPLYKLLLELDPEFWHKYPEIDKNTCRIICGYFRISVTIEDIGYCMWEKMDNIQPEAKRAISETIEIVKDMRKGYLREDLTHHPKFDKYEELFLPSLHDVFEGTGGKK